MHITNRFVICLWLFGLSQNGTSLEKMTMTLKASLPIVLCNLGIRSDHGRDETCKMNSSNVFGFVFELLNDGQEEIINKSFQSS